MNLSFATSIALLYCTSTLVRVKFSQTFKNSIEFASALFYSFSLTPLSRTTIQPFVSHDDDINFDVSTLREYYDIDN